MVLALGLTLGLVSAIAIGWAYTWQHDAAAGMETLSLRHPVHAVGLLVGDRRWLIGLGLESGGWLLYVAALRVAPLALVQGVSAAGIAVLALLAARGHPSRLSARAQVATLLAVVGLVLLALSLVGVTVAEHRAGIVAAAGWLVACAGGAAALWLLPLHLPRAAALGVASGAFFAGGDISVKLFDQGGWWLVALAPMLGFYILGTLCLQSGFQHGDALTAAGISTLATNALPIAAGFVLFGESLPGGARGLAQVAGFTAIVAGAILLADTRAQGTAAAVEPVAAS